ncbi:hypothetical protein LPW11_08525 [Geomonas sp. RF6]|uniref:hypothetical protein n=1 Tax=Geomonas sp. RF6 TaxID=2897342 RepID=UPI001E5A0DAC|nr:hypothetical protein [Geomonas sp. RF6]UFS72225.1 hypothetical protein LPW11_08525 [Geomonas sp. RF6]
MLKSIPVKLFCRLLLLVLLLVAINGMHQRAHAEGCTISASSQTDPSASQDSPAIPLDQHTESDGCDSCIDCACHAPLPVQLFHLCYIPVVTDVATAEPFKPLPEVYLSKFIPPQLLA